MHQVANPAGRLVTFRIVPPVSDDNSAQAAMDLRACIVGTEGAVIVLTDLCAARVFSEETTERFVKLMKSDNPKIAKSALLLSGESASLGLQINRMLKEAGHPGRKAFIDARELRDWLEPELTDAEKTALDRYFD